MRKENAGIRQGYDADIYSIIFLFLFLFFTRIQQVDKNNSKSF